jgi:hypothetical protein
LQAEAVPLWKELFGCSLGKAVQQALQAREPGWIDGSTSLPQALLSSAAGKSSQEQLQSLLFGS